MKSNLDSVCRAINEALWAARDTAELALQARYMQTRNAFEEAKVSAQRAREAAYFVTKAAFDDIDAEDIFGEPELWELHENAIRAAEQAREAVEEVRSATKGEPTATIAAERIAKEKLGIETLDQRYSDELDFHEVSVWRLRQALEATFCAGRDARLRER